MRARRAGSEREQRMQTRHCRALTTSELKGFALVLRVELLVRVQTLVLCLKAVLTFEGRTEGWLEAISVVETATMRGRSQRTLGFVPK